MAPVAGPSALTTGFSRRCRAGAAGRPAPLVADRWRGFRVASPGGRGQMLRLRRAGPGYRRAPAPLHARGTPFLVALHPARGLGDRAVRAAPGRSRPAECPLLRGPPRRPSAPPRPPAPPGLRGAGLARPPAVPDAE